MFLKARGDGEKQFANVKTLGAHYKYRVKMKKNGSMRNTFATANELFGGTTRTFTEAVKLVN